MSKSEDLRSYSSVLSWDMVDIDITAGYRRPSLSVMRSSSSSLSCRSSCRCRIKNSGIYYAGYCAESYAYHYAYIYSIYVIYFCLKALYLKAFLHSIYYSNSIVPGGFEVISYITLFTPRTSLIILDITLFNTS